jgi:hypothetical protein
MQQPLRKRMLTAAQFVARFKAEKALQQWRYCKVFSLWRQCPVKRCRRDQICRSNKPMCMLLAYRQLPHRAQWQARQGILDATPANIGAPERAARQCMPYDLCMANTTADAVAQYLLPARLSRSKREKLRAFRQSVIGAARAREEL